MMKGEGGRDSWAAGRRKAVSSGLGVGVVPEDEQRTGRPTRGVPMTCTDVESCLSGFFIFMPGAKRDVSAAKRFFKKKARASQCFKSFHTAERTLEGVESVNLMRKGRVKRLDGKDSAGQAKFIESLFGVAA